MPNRLKADEKNRRNEEKYPLKSIMVLERDVVRKLIIPRERNQKLTSLLSESQFNQIKKDSRLSTDEQKHILQETEKETLLEMEAKKIELLKHEIEQLNCQQVKELEEEEQLLKQQILARTEDMRCEEDDEIKKCNSLILNVKCKAIQGAQIAEKELIKQQLKQQENAIECKMEEDRKQDLKTMQKKREEDWAQKRRHAESVMQQIRNNEEKRIQQMEMIQNECKMIKLKTSRMNENEEQISRKQSAIRMQIENQNEKINDEIKRDKERRRENEKLENLKIQEYLKNKLNREKELEKRRKKENQMEEMKIARLWKLQKGTQSLECLKNEIIGERIQEQVQRKWRGKELEAMNKKIREIEETRNIREKQIVEKRKSQFIEHCEKKEEARRIMEDILKLKEEQELLKSKQKEIMEHHKASLQEQIIEKEQNKREQRQNILHEREDLLARIQKHDQIIKETMKKKIDQIKSSSISETFIKKLEKHMNLS